MKNLCETCIAYDTKDTPCCKFKKIEVANPVGSCDEYFYFEVTEQEDK